MHIKFVYTLVYIILIAVFIFSQYLGVSHGASSDSSSSDIYADKYKEGKKIRYYDVFSVVYWIVSTKIKKYFL